MKYDWSKEHLEATVKDANCWWDWMRKAGIPAKGCNYRTLKNKAQQYGIDTSHFNYEYARNHNGYRIIKNRTDEQLFCGNVNIKRDTIKRAYIQRVLKNDIHCECCGIKDWNGKPITFQLHHKDGNTINNVLENIILLCPNCHSQTENYRNQKR